MKEWKPAKWVLMIFVAISSTGIQAQQAQSQQVHAFSLQQALDYAKQNNTEVKNALLDIRIQQQTNREVTGMAYPQISASGSLAYNAKLPVSLVPAEFFGGQPGTFEKLAFGVKWGATGGVSLNQILFDGQVFVGLQARETLIKFQEKKAEITEESIRANIYKIYYQLVASKTQIELLDANIELLNKLQHDTRIMHENGFAEKLDLDKLSVQLANLQTEKTSALNQVQNGYLGLKVLMGMPVKDSLALTDSLSDEQIKNGILELSDFSYTQRKDYQYAELGVALGEYDVRRYKLAKLPTLSLNGYYNKNAQRNKFDFLQKGDWFDISAFTLQLNIPIFTGMAANARIAKAKLTLEQTVNQREALKINIDNEIETARNNFNTAVSTMDYQKKNMELAETVFRQTRKKFEVGTGSNTEITQAQTDMKAAQTNYINALYNAIIARIDYIKATGRL
ncbi:TolC family protein [Agriterribacter sp.]|uniref:TolC family protein n=1 Tax=Agriterribacter sp. TaxID=2821509 RepID=UPI002C0D9BCA|nr:TolC family protein [Agriterribacter sp.]HRP56720.1 TolC family protein [Agriterribacter sp.]